ncbi:unnamed protein product [Urochloa humidicola]
MAKAVHFTTLSNALMAKDHQQCFSSMQKLLADALADKLDGNEARRRRPRNDHGQRASEVGTPPVEEPGQHGAMDVDEAQEEPAGCSEQCVSAGDADPTEVQPLETENVQDSASGGVEYMDGVFTSATPEETHGSHHQTLPSSQGDDGVNDINMSTPDHLHGPVSGVASILDKLCSTHLVDSSIAEETSGVAGSIGVEEGARNNVVEEDAFHEETPVNNAPEEDALNEEPQNEENNAPQIIAGNTEDCMHDDTVRWDATPATVQGTRAVHQLLSHEEVMHSDTVCWDVTPDILKSACADTSGREFRNQHQAPSHGGATNNDTVRWDETPNIVHVASVVHPKPSIDQDTAALPGLELRNQVAQDESADHPHRIIEQDTAATPRQEMSNQLAQHRDVDEQAIKEKEHVTYFRRSTRITRAAEASKTKEAEEKKAKPSKAATAEEHKMLEAETKREAAAALKEKKRLEAERKKEQKHLEVAVKKAGAAKKGGSKRGAAGKKQPKENAREKEISEEERALRDEHEARLQRLREDAEEEIDKLNNTVFVQSGPTAVIIPVFPEDSIDDINAQTPPVRLSQEERQESCDNFNKFQKMIFKQVGHKLRKKPRKYISPFNLPGSRPRVPLERALAMRYKISSDLELQRATLIDFSCFISYDGEGLLTTFADDKDGDSSILDYIVHCIQYDDIVHKEDSIGYRVFFTTSFWEAAKDVNKVYMDDGKTESDEFRILWQLLEAQTEQYDIADAKLIFMPACFQKHYFVYCINLVHNRIDILDSVDYWWTCRERSERHKPVWDKLPIINAAFQKVTNKKFPRFDTWIRTFADVPKQAGPNDCMFFLWKYMEFWDGERLHIDINPFKGCIYRVELMHYGMFHPLNQADLPDELDVYRLGGRKIIVDQSQ